MSPRSGRVEPAEPGGRVSAGAGQVAKRRGQGPVPGARVRQSSHPPGSLAPARAGKSQPSCGSPVRSVFSTGWVRSVFPTAGVRSNSPTPAARPARGSIHDENYISYFRRCGYRYACHGRGPIAFTRSTSTPQGARWIGSAVERVPRLSYAQSFVRLLLCGRGSRISGSPAPLGALLSSHREFREVNGTPRVVAGDQGRSPARGRGKHPGNSYGARFPVRAREYDPYLVSEIPAPMRWPRGTRPPSAEDNRLAQVM
jgi:hypothetical protein